MKRALCFAGRIHHRDRLMPVVNALRAKGIECPYLISDNATQNDPSSEYLIPAREPFIDALSVLDSSDIQQVTQMTHSILSSIYAKRMGWDEDITTFHPPFWIAYSVREECEYLIALRKLLPEYKPDIFLSLHENNHWGRMNAYVCKELNIPHIVFQEGLIRTRDEKTQGKQGLGCEYSQRLCVWSESAKQAYRSAGIPEEKIKVVGIPHMDNWFRAMRDPQWPMFKPSYKAQLGFNPDEPLVTFTLPILHRYDGNPKRAIGLVADWSANRFTQVAFSFHPFESEANVARVREVVDKHPYAKVIGGDVLSLLAASDCVLAQHSTITTEALALGTTLAEIDLDNAGVLESLAEQGVAHAIRAGELNKILDILSGKEKLDRGHMQEWVNINVGPRDGRAVERVLAELELL